MYLLICSMSLPSDTVNPLSRCKLEWQPAADGVMLRRHQRQQLQEAIKLLGLGSVLLTGGDTEACELIVRELVRSEQGERCLSIEIPRRAP